MWLADGSRIRLRPEHPNHVWSYDFVEDRTYDGRKYRMLNIIDEFTHECLAILKAIDVIEVIDALSDLFILRGVPRHIRSDNGPGRDRESRDARGRISETCRTMHRTCEDREALGPEASIWYCKGIVDAR